MNNTIEIEIHEKYGRKLYYPANAQAQHLCDMAGSKTLTEYTLSTARLMGFEVKQVVPELNFNF